MARAPFFRRRVVVTGLGVVSPLGNGAKSSFAALLAGRSGVEAVDEAVSGASASKIAAKVKGKQSTKPVIILILKPVCH